MEEWPKSVDWVKAIEQLAQTGQSAGCFNAFLVVDEQVRRGFELEVVDATLNTGLLQQKELASLVIAPRTLRLRRQRHQALSRAESDRLARVLRIVEFAHNVFGSCDKAGRWLRRPLHRYGGCSALSMLDTDAGAKLVEQHLGQIAHGIAA